MNKYIYKVRFVTLNFQIMHKHELIFGKQQTVSTTEKTDCKQLQNSLRSMNASCLKFHA